MEPELIADYACQIGENPLWHPLEKCLSWVDIPRGMIFRYHPATGKHGVCFQGEPVGGFTIQADGALLLFMAGGAVATWRDGKLEYVINEIPAERASRFNDVIADPAGRVFGGTMSTRERAGRLYRLDRDGSITVVLENVGTSNGRGFTGDGKRMYHTDSRLRRISLYDYDRETGSINNGRVFLETPADEGVPDGMTVDAWGFVWSARWNGSAPFRYTANGVAERSITFPARKVSSVTFGGEELTDIYVTTTGGDDKKVEGQGAGVLFRLKLGISGVPEFYSRVGL